jgi:hypothetical protein
MESLSWTREPPVRPPDEYRFGGPIPEGYAWPPGDLSVGLYAVCDLCGGAVAPNHTEWHASL